MSAISLKSITGITSITTPAGVDNQLTLHNNNTTEAVKLDIAGNLHFHNHLNITGVSTASNFKTGTSNLHNTGLNVQDLDVDGHTNLDNVSIAGVTTFSENVNITNTNPKLFFYDTNNDSDYAIVNNGGVFRINDETNSLNRFSIDSNGNVSILKDLDVDGHTNLDNVSIAGVTTMTGNLTINSSSTAKAIILPDNKRIYFGDDEDFWIGSNGTNGEVSGSLWLYNHFYLYDNVRLRIGHGQDLELFHNGTDSYIDNNTNNLHIDSAQNIIFETGSSTERVRITSGGDLLLGNHGSRIFDDSSGTNVVVDIYGGTTAGKRGILALGGRTGSDNGDIGTIQFVNENNNLATAANHVQSKLVASIDVKSETTDNNSGSDSGGHLLFSTKPETGQITARLRIDSTGRVMIGSSTYIGGAALAVLGTSTTPNTYACFAMGRVGANVTNNTAIANIRLNGGTLGTGRGAEINAYADANWSDGSSHPTRLTFHTVASSSTSATERLRIDSNGKFCFGTYNAGYANNDSLANFVNAASAGTENPLITLWNPTTVADARAGIDFLTNAHSGTGRDGAFIRASNDGVTAKAHIQFGTIIDETYTETLRITSRGYREIRTYHYGPYAFTNNTYKSTITVGDPGDGKHTTVKFILTLEDVGYRQGFWQGEFVIWSSNANGGPGVSHIYKKIWDNTGSTNWNGGTVLYQMSGGAFQFKANNDNSDAAGNAYIHILDVIGDIDGSTVATISA